MDPLASLRCWPVTIELADREFTIPPVPAADWFIAILGEKPLPIVPGMLPDAEGEIVSDMIIAGKIELDELVAVQRDALEAASGWRWWEADRLIRSAGAQWRIVGGELVRRGVDLHAQPLGAVLVAIYHMGTMALDEQKRQQFDWQLSQPPAGMSEEDHEELAERMFMELMAGE